MTKEEMFHDFNIIRSLKSPERIKVGMLTYLFANDPERWRVTGITEEALKRFKEANFKKLSRLKINRSHKFDRYETYCKMMSMTFDNADEWWEYYYAHDETVLATSSENMKGDLSSIIEIDPSLGLFKSIGYSWSHRKAEVTLLEELHLSNISL